MTAHGSVTWRFNPGQITLVAAIPSESGALTLYRLDARAPEDFRDRQFAKTLLHVAGVCIDIAEEVD